MSIKKISKDQPNTFKFSDDNLAKAKIEINKYPKQKKGSAVMSLLYLAQDQNDNWIPLEAMKYIAKLLDMPYIKVYEVATFYSMYNLSPVGKYFIQVCTTTPCMIRGAKKITEACKKYVSPNQNKLSENKLCSWVEVECLGACVNAPMMQVNKDYFEDLDQKSASKIFQQLLEDKFPKPGSVKNRTSNAPEKGKTTLMNLKNA
jgi:NADH-quinone oxidoreductase E subunit